MRGAVDNGDSTFLDISEFPDARGQNIRSSPAAQNTHSGQCGQNISSRST